MLSTNDTWELRSYRHGEIPTFTISHKLYTKAKKIYYKEEISMRI